MFLPSMRVNKQVPKSAYINSLIKDYCLVVKLSFILTELEWELPNISRIAVFLKMDHLLSMIGTRWDSDIIPGCWPCARNNSAGPKTDWWYLFWLQAVQLTIKCYRNYRRGKNGDNNDIKVYCTRQTFEVGSAMSMLDTL